MKIGIIGAGAIGLLYAYYLQKESNTVTIYTRTVQQANEIRAKGITCIKETQLHTVFPQAIPLQQAQLLDDYVLVAVKQYQLKSILPELKDAAGSLIFLQNGMSHLAALKGFEQAIALGIVEHGAKKENSTTITHTGAGTTKIGIVKGDEELFKRFFSLFSPSFPFVVEKSWFRTVINKLVVNACINPLTALYRVKNGELIRNEYFHQAMKNICLEVLHVLGEKNQEEHWQRVCSVCKKTSENSSSMLTDVLQHRQTEVDAILGYILTQAKERQERAPIVSFLYSSIKGMEHTR